MAIAIVNKGIYKIEAIYLSEANNLIASSPNTVIPVATNIKSEK